MGLVQLVDEDYKVAMKQKDTAVVQTLRLIKAEFTKLQKESVVKPTEVQYLGILSKMVRQRVEAAEIYRQADRNDLYLNEQYEAALINRYVPKQLSKQEVSDLVRKTAMDENIVIIKSNMGKLVKQVLAKAAGTTDGKMVSTIVQELLTAHTA